MMEGAPHDARAEAPTAAGGGYYEADHETPRQVRHNVWMRTRTPSPASSPDGARRDFHRLATAKAHGHGHHASVAGSPSVLRLRTPSPENSYAAWKGCASVPQPPVFFAPVFLHQAPSCWMVPSMPQAASGSAAPGPAAQAPQLCRSDEPAPAGPRPTGGGDGAAFAEDEEGVVASRTRRSGRRGRRGRRGKRADPEAAALESAEDERAADTDSLVEAQLERDARASSWDCRSRCESGDEGPDGGRASGCVVSQGSVGHPHSCAPACKYFKKQRGCKDGASCTRCHLCVWCSTPRHARARHGPAGESPPPPEEGIEDNDAPKDAP